MINTYLSPILGEVKPEIIELLRANKHAYNNLINKMKSEENFGITRTGILFIEDYFDEPTKIVGEELRRILTEYGFKNSDAISLVRVLSTNHSLITDILEKGFKLNDIVYGTNLHTRLKILNLEKRLWTASYALEDEFTIYPLLSMEEELPPPPEDKCYRTQLAYLYVAQTRRDRTPEVVAEFRVWGVSDIKGKYEISKFDRVILQTERIMKGMGKKPINWLLSIKKTIKASEQDEEIDCDEAKSELNYALRGVAFRGEYGTEDATEFDESLIKHTEKKMIANGLLKTRFDNESGSLKNIIEIQIAGKEES